MGNSNRHRVQMLANQLTEERYNELAEVLIEIIINSPVYAEQIIDAQDFVNGITDVLHGLSSKDLEKFVSDYQSSLRAQTITLQATKTRNALFVSNGIVCLAFNSFERPGSTD